MYYLPLSSFTIMIYSHQFLELAFDFDCRNEDEDKESKQIKVTWGNVNERL